MPPRNPELPEGTDHIINGAMDTGGGTTGSGSSLGGGSAGASASGLGGVGTGSTGSTTNLGGGTTVTTSGNSNSGGGFVASSGSDDTGGTSSGTGGSGGTVNATAQKIAGAARSQVSTLTDQATGKMREYADQGKERATSTLDEFAQVIDQAAQQIDERLGSQYGDYAHRAAGAVTSISESLRGKTVDELLDDSRSLVRKSPGVAIGAAALLGFTLVRLVKAGLDNDGNGAEFNADRGRNIEFQSDTGGTSGRSA